MGAKPSPRFVIHPSIDSLVQRIAAVTDDTPAAEIAALRETCRGKLRSYSLESYLRTLPDPVLARTRYETVSRFAAARPAATT